jgi:hypothetical protein
MHLEFLAAYWWAVLAGMLAVFVTFVLVAGRNAAGGFRGRTGHGWARWRALSRKGAEVQARLILTLFYFTLAAPFGLARTHLVDPLRLKRAGQPRAWLERRTRDRNLDDARRQF